jgi:ABC-type transport system substrate-binding protein
MNAINALFGVDVVNEDTGQLFFVDSTVRMNPPIDDWDMYTGEWKLPGPFPLHLYSIYTSGFASNTCGGTKVSSAPSNYGFICIPDFDLHARAGVQTDQIGVFNAEILAALNEFGKRAANIPIYSAITRVVSLRDVAGLVNERGVGYSNFWTLLNARANEAFTPTNSLYAFGGSAGPSTLRWGQRFAPGRLNPFTAFTTAEFNVLRQIYDGLVISSPIEPEKVFSWMANKYTLTVDNEGNTRIMFELRSTLRWHDGAQLSAEDVRFSIINYRDRGALKLYTNVESVVDVVVQDQLKVEVILKGRSLGHLFNMDLPIIPKHLWDSDNDGIADADKVSLDFDPVAAGILIGSGPWVCSSVFTVDIGRIGTGCAMNGDGSRGGQGLGLGARILLEKFDFASPSDPFYQYMRSYNPGWPGTTQSGQFQAWSWADKNNNAKVDVIDVTSVAACYDKTAPDAQCPYDTFVYWDKLGTPGRIDIEAVVVSSHLDDTWVDPFSWDPTVLTNIVPFTP